jgi:hypothetical protein
MRRFNRLCLVIASSLPIWQDHRTHAAVGPPEGLNDRRPESFSSLYLLYADGVSVESEVRRGTCATGSLLGGVGPFNYQESGPDC